MILASRSPRRKEILENIGFKLEVIVPSVEEKSDKIDIIEKISEISAIKTNIIAEKYPLRYVVGADTVVVLKDRIIGKPKDEQEAFDTLRSLSGCMHEVITAYHFMNVSRGINISGYQITKVFFRKISNNMIKWYISTKEPMDKAGSYGIQGKGALLIDRIEGDFFNVMGFPIAQFIQNLSEIGISVDSIDKL